MSGGQQQRVAIARSMVNQPALILADEPTGNLDSHTSVEILRMFQELNKLGITVILVTHDPKVSTYAHRTIRIADGLIESDGLTAQVLAQAGGNGASHHGNGSNGESTNGHGPIGDNGFSKGNGNGHSLSDNGGFSPSPAAVGGVGTAVGVAAAPAVAAIAAQTLPVSRLQPAATATVSVDPSSSADIVEDEDEPEVKLAGKRRLAIAAMMPPTLRTALGALRRNLMRSGLTALGIIIGVGAVIAMVEIGQGSKTAIQQTIASMGANTLLVQSGAATSGGVSFGSGSVLTLTPQDSDAIAKHCGAVAAVAPIVRARAQVIYGNRNWVPMNIFGTSPSYLVVREWETFDDGAMFTEQDVTSGGGCAWSVKRLFASCFKGPRRLVRTFGYKMFRCGWWAC